MKKGIFIILMLLLSLNGFSQFQLEMKTFLSNFQADYTISKLNEDFKYYKQLKRLRKISSSSKALELKSNITHSNKNSYNQKRNQRIQVYSFAFERSENCDSAFLSLLECFPNHCIKIKEGQDVSHKITPSIFIINDTNIICVRTNCEDVNQKWMEIIQKTSDQFANSKSKIILTKCGKLTWTTKEKINEKAIRLYMKS
tara:strand:- start:57 stop:653 length:597 start_codon:yes stop_codon:yes gene_type:complete